MLREMPRHWAVSSIDSPVKSYQLDHLGLLGIFLGETVQGFVEGEQVVEGSRRHLCHLLQIVVLGVQIC